MKTTETEELILQFKPFADKCAWEIKRKIPNRISLESLQSAAYLGLIEAAHRFDPLQGNFCTYARPRIIGSIKDYLRELQWGGRYSEISIVSLDAPSPDGNILADNICDYRGNNEEFFAHASKDLTALERKVILLYYREGLNLEEIGLEIGVKKARISQIMGNSKERIRKRLAS